MCEKCDQFAEERKRLTELALRNPMPCVVCNDPKVTLVGTWVPDEKRRLAAGAMPGTTPMFSFCLCVAHETFTEENEKLVTQAILREIRSGDRKRIY